MSFKDTIKSKVLDSLTVVDLNTIRVLTILLFAAVLGIYIFFVYRAFRKMAFYSKDFNVILAGLSIIIATIMIAMQANLLVSMGMVGALSIIRFRTAIKNPLDLLYVFWSVSVGIVCGVGLYTLAVLLCVIMTLVIFLLEKVRIQKAPTVLILRGNQEMDIREVEQIIRTNGGKSKVCSTSVKNREVECIMEITVKDPVRLLNAISGLDYIRSANWLEYDGEIRV